MLFDGSDGVFDVLFDGILTRLTCYFMTVAYSSTSAKKALDPKSPYFSLMQKVENHFKSMMENASSPPEGSGKGYTQAITSENPQLRYTVGDDAATIIQARMNMPDEEFRKMITQNFSS
jgi:hypothetical protein